METLVADELNISMGANGEPSSVPPNEGGEELPEDFPIDPHVDTKTPPPEDETLPDSFPIDPDPDDKSGGS